MKNLIQTLAVLAAVCTVNVRAQETPVGKPVAGIEIGEFMAESRTFYRTPDGLPTNDATAIAVLKDTVFAGTAEGLARFQHGAWSAVEGVKGPVRLLGTSGDTLLVLAGDAVLRVAADTVSAVATLPGNILQGKPHGLTGESPIWLATGQGLFSASGSQFEPVEELNRLLGNERDVRQVAVASDGRVAVAAQSGLFVCAPGGAWKAVYPRDGVRSWAPDDVRGATFDRSGALWFASPQGVGHEHDGGWTLYTGSEGLPWNDFTTMAAGETGVVWFGTHLGAIRYDGDQWEYRQGLRWLPGDDVRAVAVTENGNAWFATAQGVGVIERRPMSLAQKARIFSDAIDKYHRRTPYGYVLEASLAAPGDLSQWSNHDSDNDGLWTGMYGAAECFRYAATHEPEAKARATRAFEALRFLSQVTQGGSHPAQPGFPARSILPTSGPNPNDHDNAARDLRNQENDPQWKILEPRWPVSADGQWYWKTDTSSDELDGHYFFYALYYDLVAETPEEKAAVREVCLAITDHLLRNGFNLVDHDGKPTRWGQYAPDVLNHDLSSGGRGLNSLSILSYLKVAGHMSGDPKYQNAYDTLVNEHAYAMNAMVAKPSMGPGSGNQSDDEMAFMSYYNLLNYEKDAELRQMYARSLVMYWLMERPELCPLFNYIFAHCMQNVESPRYPRFASPDVLAEALDTLKRFPLDRIEWEMKNSHRTDVVKLTGGFRQGGRGHRMDGKVLPIDERNVSYWNHDPWRLDYGGNGTQLDDGAAFLLPYYMGLYHGFIIEKSPH